MTKPPPSPPQTHRENKFQDLSPAQKPNKKVKLSKQSYSQEYKCLKSESSELNNGTGKMGKHMTLTKDCTYFKKSYVYGLEG